jgi:hypothetical protein
VSQSALCAQPGWNATSLSPVCTFLLRQFLLRRLEPKREGLLKSLDEEEIEGPEGNVA